MIDAFKSTLEESLGADLILLLIDVSEIEDIKMKYRYCRDVLEDLKVDKSRVLVVLTKFDGVISSTGLIRENITNDLMISNPITVSSKTRYRIHKLKTMINTCVSSQDLAREDLKIKAVQQMRE